MIACPGVAGDPATLLRGLDAIMPDDKPAEGGWPRLYKSEIFRDGPETAPPLNVVSAEQDLEVFGSAAAAARRVRPHRTTQRTYLEPARAIPVFTEADVLVVG